MISKAYDKNYLVKSGTRRSVNWDSSDPRKEYFKNHNRTALTPEESRALVLKKLNMKEPKPGYYSLNYLWELYRKRFKKKHP